MAAREQVRGRGTKGRAWVGLPGNVFLTVAIPLDRVPVPLSLIPLRVGTLIAPGEQAVKPSCIPLPSKPCTHGVLTCFALQAEENLNVQGPCMR